MGLTGMLSCQVLNAGGGHKKL